jgi:hypothetical protein
VGDEPGPVGLAQGRRLALDRKTGQRQQSVAQPAGQVRRQDHGQLLLAGGNGLRTQVFVQGCFRQRGQPVDLQPQRFRPRMSADHPADVEDHRPRETKMREQQRPAPPGQSAVALADGDYHVRQGYTAQVHHPAG